MIQILKSNADGEVVSDEKVNATIIVNNGTVAIHMPMNDNGGFDTIHFDLRILMSKVLSEAQTVL